jgi:hypothetical protein
MAPERLSRLQCRILAWLVAEDRCLQGSTAASHEDDASRRAVPAGNRQSRQSRRGADAQRQMAVAERHHWQLASAGPRESITDEVIMVQRPEEPT